MDREGMSEAQRRMTMLRKGFIRFISAWPIYEPDIFVKSGYGYDRPVRRDTGPINEFISIMEMDSGIQFFEEYGVVWARIPAPPEFYRGQNLEVETGFPMNKQGVSKEFKTYGETVEQWLMRLEKCSRGDAYFNEFDHQLYEPIEAYGARIAYCPYRSDFNVWDDLHEYAAERSPYFFHSYWFTLRHCEGSLRELGLPPDGRGVGDPLNIEEALVALKHYMYAK